MPLIREINWTLFCKRVMSFQGFGRLALLIEALFLYALFIVPPLLHLKDKVVQMQAGMPPDLPSILFDSSGTYIEGRLPFEWRLPDSTVILYTHTPDSLYLIDKPVHSLICADSLFLFKTGSRIIPAKNLAWGEDHTWRLDKTSLNKVMDFYLRIGNTLLHALGILFFLALCGVLIVFGAGVASIVDGFANGPFRFRELLRLAAAVLMAAVLLAVLNPFRSVLLSFIKWAVPVYLAIMFFLTLALIRKIHGEMAA